MNEENKRESTTEKSVDRGKTRTFGRRLLGWLGYLVVMAVMLFFFAPESWWQFGVSPASQRKSSANFSLQAINGEEWNFAAQKGKVVVVNYRATRFA